MDATPGAVQERGEGMTLEESIKTYTSNAEYERTHGNLQGCLDFRQLADRLKELKRLRKQTRWISVSERLPEKGKQVLCCNQHGSVFTSAVTYTIKHEDKILAHFGHHYGVVAWMPLPEPYKAESEDK